MKNKVWVVIGDEDDLSGLTAKYLLSRDQIVIHSPDFKYFESLVSNPIDKLIINNIQQVNMDYVIESVFKISSHLKADGTGQIIFLSTSDRCIKQLEKEKTFIKLKKEMKDQTIEVKCFEPG